MSKGIGWGHLGNYRNYRVAGAKKEQTPPSIEERQQQVFNKFNKSWEYDPEKLKPYSGWLGAPLQTGSTPSVSVTPTPTPSVTPTMTPTPSATPTPQFSPSGITGLQLWFDADDTSTLSTSGNLVESWTSKGSTPLVLTATTTTRRPEYITTGGTGSSSAVLFFSSSTSANRSLLTQVDSSQSFTTPSGYTIFKFVKNVGAKTASGLIAECPIYLYKYGGSGVYATQSMLLRAYSVIIDYIQTGATAGYNLSYGSPGNSPQTADYMAVSDYFLNGYSLDYTDLGPTKVYGEDILSGSPTLLQTTYPMTTSYTGKTINGMAIGGTNYAGTPSAQITTPTEVYEILVYNRKLTDNEFSQVMNYLRNKWDYVVDTSNSAVFNVNYTGKTTNALDSYIFSRTTPSVVALGNSYWGGQNMKYVMNANQNGEFISSFPTTNLGVNVNLTDSNGYVIDSATCRKTNSPNITYSAGTYNLTMDLDYNCIDPSPTPTETYTPSPTPTFTITPTYTPTYTPTMTPTPSATPPPPPSVSYITQSRDATNTTSYTFNSQNIGGTGLIVVVVGVRGTTDSGTSPTSVTFNGSAMTQAVSRNQGSTGQGNYTSAIYYFNHTGVTTTANFAVSTSATAQYCQIGIYRLQNLSNTTPQSTTSAGGYVNGVSSTSLSMTLTGITSGSVVVGYSEQGLDTGGVTWSNGTENFDVLAEFGNSSGMSDTSTATSETYTITYTSTTRPRAMTGAAWI